MRIHALQTGTVAIKEAQMEGRGRGLGRQVNMLRDTHWTEPLPIYAWAIEHPEGLIVIDAGETARALEPGYFPGWHPFYRRGVREWVTAEEEIGPQLAAIGFTARDVRWLVLTHMHTDHAGGLYHFPGTEILVTRKEYQTARSLGGRLFGYLPQHWPDWFAPRQIDFLPQSYGPFPAHFSLTQAGDVVLVSTPGHSAGHLSIILREGEQSIFFAGDTSYTQQLMLDGKIDGVSASDTIARQTLQHIQVYTRGTPTVYLPSHDPASAMRLAGLQTIAYTAQDAWHGDNSVQSRPAETTRTQNENASTTEKPAEAVHTLESAPRDHQ